MNKDDPTEDCVTQTAYDMCPPSPLSHSSAFVRSSIYDRAIYDWATHDWSQL